MDFSSAYESEENSKISYPLDLLKITYLNGFSNSEEILDAFRNLRAYEVKITATNAEEKAKYAHFLRELMEKPARRYEQVIYVVGESKVRCADSVAQEYFISLGLENSC
ncbi:hypothetical protein NPIL_495781 [Nephila pilipes]|uniref:Uncharacterized protein n=1 Tax=Nephila pilipes TaxID=299642 RepID=A0A8X6PSF6_NEPPI|nr:hypothetical protein NPIL_495781 [Nephila pilipes]